MDTIFEQSSQSDSVGGRKTAIAAVAAAILLTALVLAGFLFLNKRHRETEVQQQLAAQPPAVPVPSPQVVLTQDEARLKGPNALINGSIRNISGRQFHKVNVELELVRRSDGGIENKQAAVNVATLDSNQSGNYSFLVSREYKTIKVSRILEGDSQAELPFRAEAGAKRPLEGPPPTKNVVVNRSFHGKGEEFINTPDNPSKLP